MEQLPDLKGLEKALHIEITEEGLRIQLIDDDTLSMFRSGSAELNPNGRKLLQLVASVVQRLPNKVSIAGHTDSNPFRDGADHSNWELSPDRAHVSRRAHVAFGTPENRIANYVENAEPEERKGDGEG